MRLGTLALAKPGLELSNLAADPGGIMWRVLVCVLFSAPLIASAQRNLVVGGTEQRVALVIGNSTYKDARLSNPVNDATDIAQALAQFGFNVILKQNADTREMRASIRQFGAELRRAHVGLFYFAGHGVQVRGDNFLIPIGTDIQTEAEAEDLAINMNLILRTMEDAQTKVNIVVLDACRNNPFARSFRSAASGLARMDAAIGSLIAFATAPGAVAADGSGRNGVYTKHLLASLNEADTDVLKVFQRTRAAVARETGNKQIPWESTSLVGDFHFRSASAARPAAAATPGLSADSLALEVDFWNSVKDSKNPEELQAYLEQYPRGRYAALARARLKALGGLPGGTAQPGGPPAQHVALARPTEGGASPAPAAASSFRDCDACPEMVNIPAGSFVMGSSDFERGRSRNEGPQRQVTISYSFAVGKYEVTFDEWHACVSDGGCAEKPDDADWGPGRRPVINVSWANATHYVAWLSRKTGRSYRLLTEAEWEYVARAGVRAAFSWGNGIAPSNANYDSRWSYAGGPAARGEGKTVQVGKYLPNDFGLFDMHGNVAEWVQDCWNSSYASAPSDGTAARSGSCADRVVRGGSWASTAEAVRSASRDYFKATTRRNTVGFRVARND